LLTVFLHDEIIRSQACDNGPPLVAYDYVENYKVGVDAYRIFIFTVARALSFDARLLCKTDPTYGMSHSGRKTTSGHVPISMCGRGTA
jgi:hypothetical protein